MSEEFADLPDALVKELLDSSTEVSNLVGTQFQRMRGNRERYRDKAKSEGLVKRKADLDVPREPSVAAVDGSYQLHHLTALDICAAAAVAVEGTSKEAIRHWPEPYHRIIIKPAAHNADNQNVLRGLMVSMELELADIAPHDVTLIDGAFGSLIIYLNQGLSNISRDTGALGAELKQRWTNERINERLLRVLQSDRKVAVPKYTSLNELKGPLGLESYRVPDGRTLATLILEPGEYTCPLPVYTEDYHLPHKFCSANEGKRLNNALRGIRSTYYRPYAWGPAIRIELPSTIANSNTRLSKVLEGIYRQFFSPAVSEPYPLFLADRMVKSLGAGINVIEQAVSQKVVEQEPDLELSMILLRNYRTEGGRGGV